MGIHVSLIFEGQAEEAGLFYADIFQSKVEYLSRYNEAPEDEDMPIDEKLGGQVMFSQLLAEGTLLILNDINPAMESLEEGNQISLLITLENEDQIREYYQRLSENGKVLMPLSETFWSKLYGICIDRYGVQWALMLEGEMEEPA